MKYSTERIGMYHSEVKTQNATGSSMILKIFRHTSIPECTRVIDARDILFLSTTIVILVGSEVSVPMGAER
jgi:hypothetical protein